MKGDDGGARQDPTAVTGEIEPDVLRPREIGISRDVPHLLIVMSDQRVTREPGFIAIRAQGDGAKGHGRKRGFDLPLERAYDREDEEGGIESDRVPPDAPGEPSGRDPHVRLIRYSKWKGCLRYDLPDAMDEVFNRDLRRDCFAGHATGPPLRSILP